MYRTSMVCRAGFSLMHDQEMRGDTWPVFGQANRIIFCAEYGLHSIKDGDHWRCVELPDVVMLRGERYRLGDREFATLTEALRTLSDNQPSRLSAVVS